MGPHCCAHGAFGAEALAIPAIQDRGEPLDRIQTARLRFETEYEPVVAVLRQRGLLGGQTETDAHVRVTAERYRLLHTHRLSEQAWEWVAGGASPPSQ